MIKYTLLCDENHDFEGWFANAAGYERQAEAGQIRCPCCGTVKVRKAMMTPNIATSRKSSSSSETEAKVPEEVLDALRTLRREVVEKADYVGPRFAEEARKIHFGETEARGIYGEATPDEARGLADDGVEFMPIPVFPDDQN